MRFECAKNVNKATDKMMQACGGSGYKRDLGKDTQTQAGLPVEALLSRSVWLDSIFFMPWSHFKHDTDVNIVWYLSYGANIWMDLGEMDQL